jgi:dephospho-CoA kinase
VQRTPDVKDDKRGANVAPRLFGLTGGIGSGKSAVADMLRERGIPVFDADDAARSLTRPGAKAAAAVAAAFGPRIAGPGGTVDRTALAKLVFTDREARKKLEAILHPLIDAEAKRWLAARSAEGHAVCFYAAPLLFEADRDGGMEAVVAVIASPEVRVRRVVERDRTTEEAVKARMAAQLGDEQRLLRAEHILRNDGSLRELQVQLDALLKKLLPAAS